MKQTMEFKPEMSDAELKAILTASMVDAGVTGAAVYAYHKTGVILRWDNERRLPRERLRAWNSAVNEYNALIAGPQQ
jgi:hypothetical protein